MTATVESSDDAELGACWRKSISGIVLAIIAIRGREVEGTVYVVTGSSPPGKP
jgi:hypothetical protein